jgi:hypothetical protein
MKFIPSVLLLTAAASAAVGLASCGEKPIEPPSNIGICWHAIPQTDGTIKFNELSRNVPNLETCAATLEGMRIRFARLGSQQREMLGAYQGNFVFLQAEGVFVAADMKRARYLALVRTGDGRLAIPGAIKRQMEAAGTTPK